MFYFILSLSVFCVIFYMCKHLFSLVAAVIMLKSILAGDLQITSKSFERFKCKHTVYCISSLCK